MPPLISSLLPFLLLLLPSHSYSQDVVSNSITHRAPSPAADTAYNDALRILKSINSRGHVLPTKQSTGVAHFLKNTAQSFFLGGGPPADSAFAFRSHDRITQARRLLHQAASENHPDAIYLLADMHFFGNYSNPRDLNEAFQRYKQLAELNGNSSAQHMVGFYFATGLGSVVEQDQAKAMLFYTFAAEQGNERSQMAMAYRHHYGIGTPKDCHLAVQYWQKVSQKAFAYIRRGPPGGSTLARLRYRISDDTGGIYGDGASVSSAGINSRNGPANSDAHASQGDVVEWLDLISRKGDVKATFRLGQMHFDGGRDMKPDFILAKKYFLEVARSYWTKSGKTKTDVSPMTEQLAARSAGFLGWMFLRGEGTEQSFDLAKKWFKRGRSLGNSQSQFCLGLMYLDGLGVAKDVKMAADLFSAAADQDHAGAQVHLGMIHMDSGDVKTALAYFELAARKGRIEALYYLAEMEKVGIGQEASCELASHHFKLVSERAEPIVASFGEANEAYEAGDIDLALLDYMLAAEQGFEVAQTNVAYLLDKSRRRQQLLHMPLPSSIKKTLPILSEHIHVDIPSSIALLYWTRSARQSNIDALVKMGDYYLAGTGSPVSEDKAAACYQAAAETMQSAQALWNLGWMYENGLGGHEQDFHLAKRFYDQALEINKEAYLPVKLALFKLRIRSRWNSWTRGSAKSIQPEPRRRNRPNSLKEWFTAFLAAEADAAAARQDLLDELGGDYDLGSLADLTDEEIWADLVDGLLESFIILGLAAMLIGLVIYRRQRAERRAVEEQQARMQGQQPDAAAPQANANENNDGNENEDRGLFPGQGDDEFINWAVGGVGH